jgi:aerobic carbon-monoxide dehydrogenase medium subunit
MIPASFEYQRVGSVEKALDLLREGGEEAKLLAGGHSLLPLMKLRFARPSLLVDIGGLSELSYIREDGDRITIGALTRHHDLHGSDLLRRHCPLLAYTAGVVGDPQVRHRGTIGGAVAHGDPASDPPAALVALGAEFVIRGGDGERTVDAGAFFQGLFETALRPDELLTEIRVPRPAPGHGWSYVKFNRRAQDWAIVGVSAVLEKANGTVSRASVGLTNMGPRPLRARGVEEELAGGGEDRVAAAARRADEGTNPPSDTNAGAEYRKHLARVLTGRALREALGR